MRKSRKKNAAAPNDGDPWSPVDVAAIAQEPVTPPEPLEIKGGDVTARIDLGTGPAEEELVDGEPLDKSRAEHEQTAVEAQEAQVTSAEVEDAEKILAEKLAALDSARTKK